MLNRNNKILFIKSLTLLLLVLNFSASAYFVKSTDMDKCCHQEVKEVKPASCCTIEAPKVAVHKCSINYSSEEGFTATCGCFHDNESAKQVPQLTKVPESPKVQIEARLVFDTVDRIADYNFSNYKFYTTYESPPIYLIDSSFLI